MATRHKPMDPDALATLLAILSESMVLVSEGAEAAELGRLRTAEAWLNRSRRLMGASLDLLEVEIRKRGRKKK